MVEYYIKRYRRGNEESWTRHCSENAGDVDYVAMCWNAYDFESIPTSVIRKIIVLQKDSIVRTMNILTPKTAISDPVLIANCYNIGVRLIARWGEALQPIPEIDS